MNIINSSWRVRERAGVLADGHYRNRNFDRMVFAHGSRYAKPGAARDRHWMGTLTGVGPREQSSGGSGLGDGMQWGHGLVENKGSKGPKGRKAALGPGSTGGLRCGLLETVSKGRLGGEKDRFKGPDQPLADAYRRLPPVAAAYFPMCFFPGVSHPAGVLEFGQHLGRGVETARNLPQPLASSRGNLFFCFHIGSLERASMETSDRSVGSGCFFVRWFGLGGGYE
ncbi:MAG: hypothetical protein JWR26_951 [Pedosphaera sp.]|nr:hypothetical protein [Pedosphaera sp.]